jgi:ATP-dependent RNA circularization protein (DNA/RNA ligase family)
MTHTFRKFPRTPHLLWLGDGLPRDDKILTPAEAADFLSGKVTVEEKVDGANLGLSLGPDGRVRAQSRGNYLSSGRSHEQWNLLWSWLAERRTMLELGLRDGLMLFGEWCYAQHTIPYDLLPDWFCGYDIFEVGSQRFWSADRRNAWLEKHGLVSVPKVKRGRVHLKEVPSLIAASAVGHVPMEGIYLRREHGEWLQSRAKVVSAVFKQQIEKHWTRRSVVPNHLAMAQV